MATKRKTKTTTTQNQTEELEAFAHHLAEVLRIARTSELLISRLYNGIAEAWNDFTNDVINLDHLFNSEEYIRLVLKEQAEKGGTR